MTSPMTKFLALLGAASLTACASLTAAPIGLSEAGQLQPCPSAPRCVSSLESSERHGIGALRLRDGSDGTWQAVIDTVAEQPRTRVVTATATYLHAEIVSPWGFYTDDLELVRTAGEAKLNVRSSSRVGYYDFDVNRDRVAGLESALRAKGITQEAE